MLQYNPLLAKALAILFFVPFLFSLKQQRIFTSARPAGEVQVVLLGAALVAALPELQDPGGVSAGRAARGRLAAPALAVAGCGEAKGTAVITAAPAGCAPAYGTTLQP